MDGGGMMIPLGLYGSARPVAALENGLTFTDKIVVDTSARTYSNVPIGLPAPSRRVVVSATISRGAFVPTYYAANSVTIAGVPAVLHFAPVGNSSGWLIVASAEIPDGNSGDISITLLNEQTNTWQIAVAALYGMSFIEARAAATWGPQTGISYISAGDGGFGISMFSAYNQPVPQWDDATAVPDTFIGYKTPTTSPAWNPFASGRTSNMTSNQLAATFA